MMNYKSCFLGILLTACVAVSAAAQSESASKPAPSALERWRSSRTDVYMNDFGELGRYRDQNAGLKPPAPGEKRIVFFGDSITDLWPLADYFPGQHYLNRGIGGQTTSQMLVRFRQDVIALEPRAVVILAGTNDIAGNTGPMRLEDTEANYASLLELAGAHDIKVIFSSVLPVHNYTPQSQDFFAQRSPEKILELNRWLSAYCAAGACVYLDYFSAMVDANGLLRKELAEDGLHPNSDGYKIMARLAEGAIRKVLNDATPNKK